MKTLNEQIYEYLLRENRPVTVPEVYQNDAFQGVPPAAVGRGLLALCREDLAHYSMRDGKIYFTTDLSQGRGKIGSQGFIDGLGGLLGGLSGGGNPLKGLQKAFPEAGDPSADEALEKITFSRKVRGDGFEVAFPQDATVRSDTDGEHEFIADCGIVSMSTHFLPQNGEFSERLMKAMLMSIGMKYIGKMCPVQDAPDEYHGDNVIAYYLPSSPNSFVYVGRPDGVHLLRMDSLFTDGLPSRTAVCSLLERWISTYRYSGGKQYENHPPINREELLKRENTTEVEQSIVEEYRVCSNETFGIVNAIKNSAGSEEAVSQPTLSLIRTRRRLEEAAAYADELMAQAADVYAHGRAVNASSEFFGCMYQVSQAIVDAASEISASISVNASALPTFSVVDVSMAAMSTEQLTVQVFPARYMDFLELITAQRLEEQSLSQEEQDSVRAFSRKMKARYEAANRAPEYYPDFLFDGKMLAAYLGHDEEVVVPDFVTSIGPSAFRNVRELKKITLGENVTAIGFAPFEGCTALETMVVLSDRLEVQGPLFGFSSRHTQVVQGYAGSKVEQYCRENNIGFEALSEDQQDSVIELEDNAYDVYEGFALPMPVGYKTTQELTASEREKLASDEATAGLLYSMVPSDTAFADFRDVRFSVSVTSEPQMIPGQGIRIAREMEQRFPKQTLHDVYRTVEADEGRILVRYDIMKEDEENGVPWAVYLVFIAREEEIIIAQIFFNGAMTSRQRQCAIDQWAGRILTQKTYQARQQRRGTEGAQATGRRRRSERFGHAAAADAPVEKQDTHEQKQRQLAAEGERLFDDFMKKRNRILESYNNESHQAYMESDFGDITKMYRIRTRFRRIIINAASVLRRSMHELSDDGEKLVRLGADMAFIHRMISTLQDALEDLKMDVDLEDFGGQYYSYEIPEDTLALVSKWNDILTGHPDYAADHLRRRREEETKRLHEKMDRLQKQIAALQEESAACPQTVRQAEEAYEASAATLEQRIAAVRERYDDELREKEEHRDWLKGQQEACAQQTQQIRDQLNRTFVLAFGRKKSLQAQLDELIQRNERLNQEFNAAVRVISDICGKKSGEMNEIELPHAQLREAMEQAQQRMAHLPVELAGAQEALANARMRLDRVPDMTLEELSALTKQPADAPQETQPAVSPVTQPAAAPAIQTIMTQGDIVNIIMRVLAGSSGMTISEIMSSDPELEKLSNQRIATIVRRMCDDGRLEREERYRKAYFRLR